MRKRIKVPLVEFESKVPVIKLNLGGREFFALADTGSESTLFDEEMKNIKGVKKKHLNSDMSFVGLQGKTDDRKITILSADFEVVAGKVRIGGISADLSSIADHFKRSYDSDIRISVLLGCDFLEAYDAVIDFDEHMLFLYDE